MKSMTAFGRATAEWGSKTYTVEIRSVNSRFFDCTVKAPRAYGFLEEKIKSHLQNNIISRGKIDVSLSVIDHAEGESEVRLDEGYLRGYLDALYRLRDTYGLKDDISVMSVASNKDILLVTRKEEDMEGEWERVLSVLDRAGCDHTRMREAEGERIGEDLKAKVGCIRRHAAEIAAASEICIRGYREKLETRLRSVLEDHALKMDEARILTECAIMADKLAVDEELVRLSSHFAAFGEILSAKEPVGRKLDFLMQEMNRETNTIGSKCADAQIASHVVEIKCELEKIREQIQNLE